MKVIPTPETTLKYSGNNPLYRPLMPSDLNMCLKVPKSPVLYTLALPPAPSTCILLLTRSNGNVATNVMGIQQISQLVDIVSCKYVFLGTKACNYKERMAWDLGS